MNLCENQYLDKPNSIILKITRKQPNFQQINTAFMLLYCKLTLHLYEPLYTLLKEYTSIMPSQLH